MKTLLIDWISEQAACTSSLIMLASDLSIDQLRDALTERLEIIISENMDAMLRYYDPRIFEKLVEILTTEQVQRLCSPARTWWYVNRMGKLVKLEGQFKHIGIPYRRLELNQVQEFSLINASEPDQVVQILLRTMPRLESLMPSDRHGFIVDSIRSASRSGLHSIADFALYSAMVLLHGTNFQSLPYWRDVLPEVLAGRIPFAETVAQSEDIAWGD